MFYPNVELLADFPDDMIEEDDEIVLFPGRNIAEALGGGFAARGYRVEDPEHAGEHGWELNVHLRKRRFWIQVSPAADNECLLMTENMTWRLWPDRSAFQTFLLDLQAVLKGDPRFTRIKWLPKDLRPTGIPASDSPIGD